MSRSSRDRRRTQRSTPAGDRAYPGALRCTRGAVPPARVVLDAEVGRMLAAVGFVVTHHQARLRAQPCEEARGARFVPVPEHADVPGPGHAAHHWGEGVDGDHHRHHAADAEAASMAAIASWYGSKKQASRVRRSNSDSAALPGITQPSALGAEGLGIVRMAITVDDQARVAGQHGGRVQGVGEPSCQFPGPESQAMCCRSPVSSRPSRCIALRKRALAWSQMISAGASPCSRRTTNGAGSLRPIKGCGVGGWAAGSWACVGPGVRAGIVTEPVWACRLRRGSHPAAPRRLVSVGPVRTIPSPWSSTADEPAPAPQTAIRGLPPGQRETRSAQAAEAISAAYAEWDEERAASSAP